MFLESPGDTASYGSLNNIWSKVIDMNEVIMLQIVEVVGGWTIDLDGLQFGAALSIAALVLMAAIGAFGQLIDALRGRN